MKKIWIMLLVSGLLLSCNDQNNSGEKEKVVVQDTGHHELPVKPETLTLNNGAKWKADSTTRRNVALLQKIVSGAKKNNPENYLQTGKKLEEGLTKMVTECKMQGADHEALHHWLEPIMEGTRSLKKTTSVDNANSILTEIEKQLNLFPQYFE